MDKLPENLPAGVYFGWATLHGKDPVYQMVMSIGWNPFFKNEKKTAVCVCRCICRIHVCCVFVSPACLEPREGGEGGGGS